MEKPTSPDRKTAEAMVDRLKYELPEAREEVESLGLIQQRAHMSEHETQDLYTSLQVAYTNSQAEVKELKKRYNALHKSTTAQLQKVEGRKKQAEVNTQMALMRVEELSEELQQCKDELFNLQPPNQVADTQIGAEWETLCSGITSWIDNQSGGIEDLRTQLRDLKAETELSEALDQYWGEDRQLLANHYSIQPNIFEELIRYNIHRLLEDRIFHDRVYMVGLHQTEAKTLHTIERLMATMTPPRGKKQHLPVTRLRLLPPTISISINVNLSDPSSIGLWRSEALLTLSSTPSYERLRDEAAQRISQEASDFLEPLLPRRKHGAMSVFHREVTLPAIKLASTMRQSTATYRFVFRVAPNKYAEERPPLPRPGGASRLYKADLEDMDVLDVGSNIMLKKGRDYEEANDGSIAESILVVHPALHRVGPTEGIALSKQVVLANLFKPPLRRGQARDVESSRGLLGFMFS